MGQFNAHQHSEHSFLDGYASVKDIARRAKEIGHEYFTLTDHGDCSGHMSGAKAAQEAGLGFVPGMEGYWLLPEALQKARDEKYYPSPSHICFLAKNETGLHNLWALSSVAYSPEHFYYKPIATPDLMRQYSEGLYASDGCMMTEFAELVEAGDEDGARALLGVMLDIYGENFYMELHTWQYMNPSTTDQIKFSGQVITTADANARMSRLNQAKVRLANELGVPLVVVNDSHHAFSEDWFNKELVWAFSTSKGKDADKMEAELASASQKADHLMAEHELHHWMGLHGVDESVIDEAIANSQAMAESCKVEIKPTLSMPAMADSEVDDLRNLMTACKEGFKKYVVDEGLDQEKYYNRLEEELTLISDKNFAGYFNMVRDYTMAYRSGSWSQYVKAGAEKEPLLIGPGRGSVGGSLVAYLTGIDIIDPVKYGTLFSRFLSPGRVGMPDVDVDVPQSTRKENLKYLSKRFGEGNVCVIATLSHSGPKATIKDMGRALGITKLPGGYADLNTISSMIEEVERAQKLMRETHPDAPELTWAQLIEAKGGALAPFVKKYPELFAQVEKMVDLIRQPGVHAAGVLVSKTPLLGAIPMRFTRNGVLTTQFDMWEVEELGGVKLDLLGIRHLDTLSVARNLIHERHGVWIDYDRSGLSVPEGCTNVLRFGDKEFNDPAIWPQIDKGHTTGIFQVETANLTAAAMDFKPRSEVDVADLTSIVRPGVADAGLKEVYLRRRSGQEPVVYDHPLMERFVGPSWSTNTYGILVYQEQIIECVQQLAGFTPDEADGLRKAVGKKNMEKLKAYQSDFIQGCWGNKEFMDSIPKGKSPQDWMDNAEKVAYKIWVSIEASGRYAFNWSHAVGYSFISTWEVWTKHHYPQEFLVGLMQTDSKNINKYIREARRSDVPILPPDVNLSEQKFIIEGKAIRYGIDTVRGVGAAACGDILKHRPYTSLDDYLSRAKGGADKTVAYNLIRIGALDSIGDRTALVHGMERFRAMDKLAESTLKNPEKLEKALERRMASGKYTIEVPDFSDPKVVYEIEKELVGTYVTVDPMGKYLPVLDKVALRDPSEMYDIVIKNYFVIGGEITTITPTVTKKGRSPGQQMAHMSVSWNDADFRVVIFPEAWKRTKDLLAVGAPVACKVQKLSDGCCLETVERLDWLYERGDVA